MKTSLLKFVLVSSLATAVPTAALHADIIFDLVTVGDPGNSPDNHSHANRNGYGHVNYSYQIGTYEVTNAQYAEFLNAAAKSDPYNLYHVSMGEVTHGGIERGGSEGSYVYTVKEGHENRPVVFVDLSDAMYFSNWLTNGQGSGDISTGSYDMSLPIAQAVNRLASQAPGQVQYFIASENEWYKAAYYDPTLNDGAGGYWAYATQSDTAPSPSGPTALPNRGNLNRWVNRSTSAGSYEGSYSYYGAFDFEGNVSEFTDTLRPNGTSWVRRGVSNWGNNLTGAANLGSDPIDTHAQTVGFRIVAVTAIPEPSGVTMLSIAGAGMLVRQQLKRKKSW